jgi:D-ornithine 4,5-aminomutase subunit alpha
MKQRNDDFLERRKHLEKMSDQQLKDYFYELTDNIVDPLLKLAYDYTTPAIERSVLMRMGFSSLESKTIIDRLFEQELLAYGAGHIVYIYAELNHLSIREAGLKLLDEHDFKNIKERLL